jgi:CDP-diacylglycerol--serine O-phosphatidyltransferase
MKRLVSILSLLALAAAVAAIILLLQDQLIPALLFLLVGFILDMVDGPIARKYGAESRQGATLDMITDIPLYLIFPAILLFRFGVPAWLLGLFVLAGVFRLVRFTLLGHLDKKGQLYYQGVPVYYSHSLILFYLFLPMPSLLLAVLVVALTLLMISRFPVYKLKPQHLSVLMLIYLAIALWKLT